MIEDHRTLAYGIGNLTPEEFGDLAPWEFVPYIQVKIEREKERIKMENERFGLIAATIINSSPYRKKGSKLVKAGDFFVQTSSEKKKGSTLNQLYDKMRNICGMMGGYNRGV